MNWWRRLWGRRENPRENQVKAAESEAAEVRSRVERLVAHTAQADRALRERGP